VQRALARLDAWRWDDQAEGLRGGWPQQAASGIFFQTAVLDYRLYRDIFPAWALALAEVA